MKCNQCNTEMFVDSTEVNGNTETFFYKCPNPNCTEYGYGRGDNNGEENNFEGGTVVEE